MRVPVRPRRFGFSFDLTPLIDVVFNLVIFFLVASHVSRSEATEQVQLPAAGQVTDDENPRRLLITVQPDGTYIVGGRAVTLEGIRLQIAEGAESAPGEFAVRIRGDRSAAFKHIQPIMLACAQEGIGKFGFKVIQE